MTAILPPLSVSDSRIPTDTVQVGNPTRTITDCPECVWRDFGATGLDRDFAREWSHTLHSVGAQAIQEPLIQAWRRRGVVAELVCHHTHKRLGTDPVGVSVETCHEVWQEAVDAVSGEELVFRAGLTDQYAAWVQR